MTPITLSRGEPDAPMPAMETSGQLLRPNAPSVVSEIIDGEAVIMNLASGHYFSAQGTGGELWALIEGGATEQRLVGFLRQRYGIDEAGIRTDVGVFLAQLHEHGLVNSAPVAPGDPGAVTPVAAATRPYLAPVLNAYSDMQDLLLLDPIHDVAEEGWPIPKPVDS